MPKIFGDPEHLTDAFWKDGYVAVHDMVDTKQLAFARHAMDASLRAGRLKPSKKRLVPHSTLNGGARVLSV